MPGISTNAVAPVTNQPQTVSLAIEPTVIPPPNVVPAKHLKTASSFTSYPDFCPYCKTHVNTDVEYSGGTCFWLYLLLEFFLFPFCFCMCCKASKDVHHFCPNCRREISFKPRFCL